MVRLSIFNIQKKPSKEKRFRELFLAMHPKLIRYATTLMGDADEAKDIVSEVFGKAWQDFDSLGERIYFRMKREHSIEEVLEVLNDLGIAQFCMKGNRIVVAKK